MFSNKSLVVIWPVISLGWCKAWRPPTSGKEVHGGEMVGDTGIDPGDYSVQGIFGDYKRLLMQGSTMAGIKINLL